MEVGRRGQLHLQPNTVVRSFGQEKEELSVLLMRGHMHVKTGPKDSVLVRLPAGNLVSVATDTTLDVDLVASIYAAWHLLEYGWSYNVASLAYTFPQSIRINVGEIGYSSVTGMRWPKLSDVSMEPADISPLKMIEDIMAKRKTSEKPRAAA